MSTLSDSGFEEELHSPSPSHQHLTQPCPGGSGGRLPAEGIYRDYDESCFIIQRNNQENFLALDCLARQPQVTGEHSHATNSRLELHVLPNGKLCYAENTVIRRKPRS